MADQEASDTSQQEEIVPGGEPGSSRNSVLVSTESYEDVEEYLENENFEHTHKRLPSGTIHEIKGDSQVDDSSLRGDTPSSIEGNAESSTEKVDVNCSSVVQNHTAEPHSEEEEEEEVNYVHTAEWKQHRKHVFILSEAGKPIYSRHGDEDKLVTLMGVMQAIVSVVQDNSDLIRCVTAGGHKFVFLVRDHIILVAATQTCESKQQILLQLTYLYNQVLSVLTYSQLNRIFTQRRNYDLRRLLTGAEKFFDNLLNLMESDPSFLLGAVRCLPMDISVRETIAQTIAQNAKVKDLVFAILVADNQLVTLVRLKKYFLHPLDLHLIFNLVSASESFKTAESWTPICLPKFDSGGYLHGHISYIDDACRACLLLLTVDKDMFFTLSDCKHKIQERLLKQNCMKGISNALQKTTYSVSQCGIPDLRHFLYKSKSTAQFTSPQFDPPYTTKEDQHRVFSMYQYLHHRIHSVMRPLKVLFHVGPYETLLGWSTSGFELYAVFGPLVTKPVAINSVNKLLKWIKKEEEKLFILNSPTF